MYLVRSVFLSSDLFLKALVIQELFAEDPRPGQRLVRGDEGDLGGAVLLHLTSTLIPVKKSHCGFRCHVVSGTVFDVLRNHLSLFIFLKIQERSEQSINTTSSFNVYQHLFAFVNISCLRAFAAL